MIPPDTAGVNETVLKPLYYLNSLTLVQKLFHSDAVSVVVSASDTILLENVKFEGLTTI
jgi:hypothetical protein